MPGASNAGGSEDEDDPIASGMSFGQADVELDAEAPALSSAQQDLISPPPSGVTDHLSFWFQGRYQVQQCATLGQLILLAPSLDEADGVEADPILMDAAEAVLAEMLEPDETANIDLGYLRLYDTVLLPNDLSRKKHGIAEVESRVQPTVHEQKLTRDEDGTAPDDALGVVLDDVEGDRPPQPIGVSSRQPAPSSDHLPRDRPSPVYTLGYELPSLEYLTEPPEADEAEVTEDVLEETAGKLEKVIRDFGVKGQIIHVHPGPVVTLYELEPPPGTKSNRIISLTDDIARSMSAVSARVAVLPGRNAIGIELPNAKRETVYLRELLAAEDFESTKQKLALCLGKTIGGEPVIADLARMPHLLVAGTTGSGKSVAINTMILSLLYRMKPEECRLIMVDPKMLELSVYDGIPHLLSPVVTDPKKAVIALKWAVREMEERYKKMSKLGVRNIDGFNARVSEARRNGEVLTRTVQTGFDRETGAAVYEDEIMDLAPLPYIVVIVDEMADLMMVAGKDIEGAIQRLAQMARAAGIHVILATQRPSVDVITGTIKANFPTRISFQVTSKIDSRTILGEMGAEQLLGQGDMLYMAGGGRITRVHGPFVSDTEVEKVVAHLKRQGRPSYLDAVTAGEDEDGGAGAAGADTPIFDKGEFGAEGGDLYDQAVAVVLRDKKASTSYIQRRLQIGYNRAASLMERMENEGIVGAANHAGKREILLETADGGRGDDD
ncbi:MAG: DNA translocase FtsK, partial [Microvirga sp.]